MTTETQRRLDELMCGQKVAFLSKWEADDLADRHLACLACTSRIRMRAYRCPVDPLRVHWHIGHGR